MKSATVMDETANTVGCAKAPARAEPECVAALRVRTARPTSGHSRRPARSQPFCKGRA